MLCAGGLTLQSMAIPGFPSNPTPARLWLGCCFVLALLSIPNKSQAADSAIVSVGATVLSKNICKFNSSASAILAFGNIDPASNLNATAAASLIFKCAGSSASASYALSQDSGLYNTGTNLNRMKHASLNEYLPYTLTLTPSSGTVAKNTNLTINLTVAIAPASFQDASIGTYADTVVITLVP